MTMFIGIFDTDTLLMVDIIENFDKIKKRETNTSILLLLLLLISLSIQRGNGMDQVVLAGWLAKNIGVKVLWLSHRTRQMTD